MKNGGPAFPHPDGWKADGIEGPGVGMFLRDYIATKAMEALVAHDGRYPEPAARAAYEYADAMLLERAKK